MTAANTARLSQRRRSTLVANRRQSMFAEFGNTEVPAGTRTVCTTERELLTKTEFKVVK